MTAIGGGAVYENPYLITQTEYQHADTVNTDRLWSPLRHHRPHLCRPRSNPLRRLLPRPTPHPQRPTTPRLSPLASRPPTLRTRLPPKQLRILPTRSHVPATTRLPDAKHGWWQNGRIPTAPACVWKLGGSACVSASTGR